MNKPPFSIYSRRNFLRTAGGSLLAAGLPFKAFADDEDKVVVSIYHTTDLHGHIVPTKTYADQAGGFMDDVGGLARCVTQIRAWQKENPNYVLLDIGDVYQGTHVSWKTEGLLMMKLLNAMNYDAWIMGNHEFDWGLDILKEVVKTSTVPVVTANAKVGDVWVNKLEDKGNPLSKVLPYIIKEVAGFKIAVIGSITPGLPKWSRPELLEDFVATDPVSSVTYALKRCKEEGVDAVVFAGHMGLKGAGRPDDFANRIQDVAEKCGGINVIIAGHTHKDLPNEKVNGVPYTQANYYGIHCGRVDLVFSKSTRQVVDVRCTTKLMDKSVEQDAMILSASAKEREGSDAEMTKVVGEITDKLSKDSAPGAPAETLLLLTRAMRFSLEKRKVAVDGVLHGNFLETDLEPGKKTLADLWEIIPYENRILTADFTRVELMEILGEVFASYNSTHNLDGMKVTTEGKGKQIKVTDITLPDGKPLDPEKRYRIALNTYDSCSGGGRYDSLKRIVDQPEAKATMHEVQSRDALVEFLTEKKTVGKADLS